MVLFKIITILNHRYNKNIMKKEIIFSTLVLLIILAITACQEKEPSYDALATCLTENGAKMYGTDWCSHCNSQKEEFGDSFKKIEFINCGIDRLRCREDEIEAYPTWIINEKKYVGSQKLSKLASLSGCEI
jgi:hypothetical protein